MSDEKKPPVGASPSGWHSIEAGWRCEKEYQLRHVRGIYTPRANTPDPFGIGLCFHAGRARWFTRGFTDDTDTWVSIVEAVREEAERQKLPVSLDAEKEALTLLQRYVEHYSKLPRPRPIATEYEIGPARIHQHSLFYRTARLDDVSYYPEGGDGLWIGEAKTTSGHVTDCQNEYELHGQVLMQALLWKVSPQGEAKHGKITGVMLDVVKKLAYGEKLTTKTPMFSRYPIVIPETTLTWYAKNLDRVLKRVSQIDWNTDTDRDVTQCTRMYGRARVACEYRDLCKNGKNAAGLYVYGDGKPLSTWRPDKEKDQWQWPWL